MDTRINADFPSRWFDLERLVDETFCRSIEFRREIGSTNDLAMSDDRSGNELPLLVVADDQTSGRGRGSNQWWSREGALTFSLKLMPQEHDIKREQWPLISLTTAISVADTLSEFASDAVIGLKWPNDVHLSGRKVAGILVEVPPGRDDLVIIGVGINVLNSLNSAPEAIRSIAHSLVDETRFEHSPCDVLVRFLRNFDQNQTLLAGGKLNLRKRWASQCVLTGRSISLQSGDHEVSGRCLGIDDEGAVRIESDGEIRSWYGGVVRIQE